MSALTDFLGGGGGGTSGPLLSKEIFFKLEDSQTFEFPFTGKVNIYAIGAGGSGCIGNTYALSGQNPGNTTNAYYMSVGTGGGAGGTAIKKSFSVTKGDKIVVTVGAGGTLQTSNPNSNNQALANGGATTVNTNSNNITIALTANGGTGGKTGFENNTACFVASGGNATGGDENYSGGSGGTINVSTNLNNNTFISNLDNCTIYTGGGAVGINQDGGNGGNVVITKNTNSSTGSKQAVTGGGGSGGDASSVAFYANDNTAAYYAGFPGNGRSANNETQATLNDYIYYETVSATSGLNGQTDYNGVGLNSNNNMYESLLVYGQSSKGSTYVNSADANRTTRRGGPGAGGHFSHPASYSNNAVDDFIENAAQTAGQFGGGGVVEWNLTGSARSNAWDIGYGAGTGAQKEPPSANDNLLIRPTAGDGVVIIQYVEAEA